VRQNILRGENIHLGVKSIKYNKMKNNSETLGGALPPLSCGPAEIAGLEISKRKFSLNLGLADQVKS